MMGISKQQLHLPFSWSLVALGGSATLYSLAKMPFASLDSGFWVIALILATCSSRLIVKIPGTKGEITVSDTFIFLALLLYGAEAAVLLAVLDGVMASTRVAKKLLTFLLNPAVMACATITSAWVMKVVFAYEATFTPSPFSARYVAMICALAFVQYIVNSGLAAIRCALLFNQPLIHTWTNTFLWTSITYFAGASAAGLISRLISTTGIYMLVATAPIIAVVYFTYRIYLKNVEVSQTQAEQAQKHVEELSHHIAEQTRISKALKEREEQFRSAFDHAAGMALVSTEGRWLKVNQSFCQMLDYTQSELLATTFQALTHPEDLGNDLNQLYQLTENKEITAQSEKRFLHKSGREVWVMQSISLVRDSEDRPLHFIFQILDVTERKQSEEKIYHAAFHDALTGLPNRILLTERLSLAVERAKRYSNYQFAVLFIDLDRFKSVNDSLGHQYGDMLLVQVAERLQFCVRKVDTIARLGGDEFAILLDGAEGVENATPTADRIQRQLNAPFDLDGKEAHISGSIGIAFSVSGYQCPEDILRDSDLAMYRAKSNGKARYEVFDQSMHDRAVEVMQLETDLRHAIEQGQLQVFYQPIIALDTQSISGFEALVRWQHPQRGIISPAEFIPLAEETGLIIPLDLFVLEESCRQTAQWQHQFQPATPFTISINLSARHFKQADLVEKVEKVINQSGVDPRSVRLEITESLVMENPEEAIGILQRLKLLGVKLSLDDFGTGYSSLSYLHRFPFDILKIDRSFVMRMEQDQASLQIVEIIMILAEKMGMRVVAEGIETAAQLEHLKKISCPYGQGYLFSKPVIADTAELLLLNEPRPVHELTRSDDKPLSQYAM